MSEITLYEAQKKKLQGLCEEHELTYRFRKDTYPITLTISPLQGVEAQMTMLEESEETGYRSPESSMTWIFEDGNLTTRVSGGTFTISKVLRTKIESVLLKMISFWQQYFFREVIEKDALRKGMMPVINEAEANDPPDGAEPLEKYEMEDDGGPEDISTEDPDIQAAIEIVRAENKATTALLQRRMSIGYAKAARIMDALEELGIVGPFNGGEPREVLPADEPEDEG